ncbi:hypothetical protein Ndes2526B_g04413 [Nannochloris sp. 'desiccata']
MDVQTAPPGANQTRPPAGGPPPLGSQQPPRVPELNGNSGKASNGNLAPHPAGFMGGIRPPPPGGFRPPPPQQGPTIQIPKMPPNSNALGNETVPMKIPGPSQQGNQPQVKVEGKDAQQPHPCTNGNANDGEPGAPAQFQASDILPPHPESPHGGVSPEDIQTVQNLVERCLQLYMARDEVVNVLKSQATIDPGFTQLVWSKLEEQNSEFFKCYYTRLKLKAQIVMFNHLLEQQVAVVQRMQLGWNGGAGAGGPSSSTTSGIPLFQSGANGNRSRTPGGAERDVDGHTGGGGGDGRKDRLANRLVPAGSKDLMTAGLDAHVGPNTLFSPLPNLGSDHDLGRHLEGHLPTPGELGAFLPGTSPLNLAAHGSDGHHGHHGAPGTLPRNFSLSDLVGGGLEDHHHHGHGINNGDDTPPSLGFSEPMI